MTGCRREAPEPVSATRPAPGAATVAATGQPVTAVPMAPDVVLEPARRAFPGAVPSPFLYYRNPAATQVVVSGNWDEWRVRRPMTRRGELWVFDVRALKLPPEWHEFKFVIDGEWEPGANRILAAGAEGWLERPAEAVLDARIEDRRRIAVYLQQAVATNGNVTAGLSPAVAVRQVTITEGRDHRAATGYVVSGDYVIFCFDDAVYRTGLRSNDTVCVAGDFNGWSAQAWRLDWVGGATWQKAFPAGDVRGAAGEAQFKFVANGTRWIGPRPDAPNAASDAGGNRNFRLNPGLSIGTVLSIETEEPLALSNRYTVVISNLAPRVIRHPVRPGSLLDRIRPEGPLGLALDRSLDAARVTVFAPRAVWMNLCVADMPERVTRRSGFNRVDVPMRLNPADGTWTAEWAGVTTARYYGFRLDGARGLGDSFDREALAGDPYARAVVNENGPCIAIDPDATNAWFGGWTDAAYSPPARQDMVIYETHVRDLTIHPSSGVPPSLRGTFEGVVASRGTGTGLDHLKALGVNMIEFMPVQEFDNGTNAPGWGYSPDFYFAPESSYGRSPAAGSQYYEFKRLVNELHRQGFGVILDVVYNHVGGANSLGRLDRRVYFRLDANDGYSNFSGCGNDLRTESPAMRRLIIDNILYWIREHHVDGFRFDLAELIDRETLMAVEAAARAANPNVVLISEPWSFRGDHKRALKGTSWAAWNNEFTHPVRSFIRGLGRSDEVSKAIAGSTELWTAYPLQSVNYFESHDDMTLADELASAPGRDGRQLSMADVARNRLAATVLFTSLGMPMLAEGQEFLRSKHGIRNTYAEGDAVNAIRWTDRERPMAREALAYYQGMIRLRQSPEGASFRLAEPPPAGYYDWIVPAAGQLLGYRVNARHERPGRAFVVLVNAGQREESFDVEFPAGTWRLVGDGQAIDPAGARVKPLSIAGGARNRVPVPALTAYVFMDGV